MAHLGDRSGIEHEHFVAARDERIAEMRAEKARAACYQNSHVASDYVSTVDPLRRCAASTFRASLSAPPSPAATSTAPPASSATISPGAPRYSFSSAICACHTSSLRPFSIQNAPG